MQTKTERTRQLRRHNPLDKIPSAAAIESRLKAVVTEAQQLQVLLDVAKKLEHLESDDVFDNVLKSEDEANG